MEGHGKDNLVEQLKRGCLSPEKLELKKGAVVIFTKNNFQRGFVNGTVGTVIGFDQYEDEGYPIVKTRQGRKLTVEPMEWTIEENGEAIAKIKQVPLRLAWAMTIHKSQGITLDSAFMDLNGAFVEGQGYVALSRVKTLDGLHLAGYNDKALTVHPIVLEQDHTFRQLSDEAEIIHTNLTGEQFTELNKNFIVSLDGKVREEGKKSDTQNPTSPVAKSYSVETIREKHVNAYRPWQFDEETSLISHYKAGKTIQEISNFLGRKTGAIRSRLAKLQLIED